jgi:hypothetical protein
VVPKPAHRFPSTRRVGSPGHLDVNVHVASGAERDRLWREVVLARAPSFASYEEWASRYGPAGVRWHRGARHTHMTRTARRRVP